MSAELSELEELKFKLLNQGMQVSDAARLAISGPLSSFDYATTSGMVLYWGKKKEIYGNVPLAEHNPNIVTPETPYLFDLEGQKYVVRTAEKQFEVEPIPLAAYYAESYPGEKPEAIETHADRGRLSPVVKGCGMKCNFCSIPFMANNRDYRQISPLEAVNAVRVAVDDPRTPAQRLLISGGTPRETDYDKEKEIYRAITENFPNLDVDIMMAPARSKRKGALLDPQYLFDIGIHGLSINLEFWNEKVLEEMAHGKALIGREEYLRFIGEAVKVFGPGRVRSLILVCGHDTGDSLEDTLNGVKALAELGCDPVLSPFRPDPATPLSGEKPPSEEEQRIAYLESRNIVDKISGVVLGPRCIPDQHNTLTFPDASGAYYYTRYDSLEGKTLHLPYL